VSGAAFTTYNPWVDGDSREICKNSIINCNIYGAKEYVWLNGGPAANGLTDGDYFFAVLVPGGQPDPNDGGAKNLSDDFDDYGNRTFTVSGGEVSEYEGTHWMDSGDFIDPARKICRGGQCGTEGKADGAPPLIRLFPYADTWNPGGVYILAICTLENGYPVQPRDCKYDAFKVKEGKTTYQFMLSGYKFNDLNVNGAWDDEPGLSGWQITIHGTGFLGEDIHEVVTTGAGGYWEYESVLYTFTGSDKPQNAYLTVCEVQQSGWVQSYPAGDCWDLTIVPSGVALVEDLNFGNFIPEGCTPGFWQGGPDKPDAKAGGALLWDGDDVAPWGDQADPYPHVDAQWKASGGAWDEEGGNPYIHEKDFNAFFGGGAPGAYTMFELVNTGGGSENWRKAARSLVAAYLNASWGMSYPYSTEDLKGLWTAAAGNDVMLLALHTDLDAANNAYYRDETERPHCPISASGW
jgi:hypothetical protein